MGVIIDSVGAGAAVVLLILSVLWVFLCRKRKASDPTSDLASGNPHNLGLSVLEEERNNSDENRLISNEGSVGGYKGEGSVEGYNGNVPITVLEEATNNFDASMVIGRGGFGRVYKGVSKDGTPIAVKCRSMGSNQGHKEFKTEIDLLSGVRHNNVVGLIGHCATEKDMMLVYEYMEQGTLEEHLRATDRPLLSWIQRLKIRIGAASGLAHLHSQKIIHRDVKSSNILLDKDLVAKISDFGISKLGPQPDNTHVSTEVKGSFGYFDPEYFWTRQLTVKTDVYSFGIVMLEVLCGRPVILEIHPEERENIAVWAKVRLERGELQELVDQRIKGTVSTKSLRKFIQTAKQCLEKERKDRPSMGDILWNLNEALRLQYMDSAASGARRPRETWTRTQSV